jgi:hypothetical protein
MNTGLDAGTAFEILSIDIADIDVGDNIGAKLQADQANADKQRFQAEAEKRRALAMAWSRKIARRSKRIVPFSSWRRRRFPRRWPRRSRRATSERWISIA